MRLVIYLIGVKNWLTTYPPLLLYAVIEWPLGWLDTLKTQFSILQTNIFPNSLDWRNRFGRYWKNSAVEVLPTANWLFWPSYSPGQKKCYNYCFMKQKCQLQEGTARYRNVTTLLSSKGLSKALSNEVCNFVSAPGAQKLSLKVEM